MSALARLLKAATPGPWIAEMAFVRAELGRDVASAHGDTYGDSDCNAALIALAPDMARLLIDMADALAYVDDWRDRVGIESPEALLARFAELEQRAAP